MSPIKRSKVSVDRLFGIILLDPQKKPLGVKLHVSVDRLFGIILLGEMTAQKNPLIEFQ